MVHTFSRTIAYVIVCSVLYTGRLLQPDYRQSSSSERDIGHDQPKSLSRFPRTPDSDYIRQQSTSSSSFIAPELSGSTQQDFVIYK